MSRTGYRLGRNVAGDVVLTAFDVELPPDLTIDRLGEEQEK